MRNYKNILISWVFFINFSQGAESQLTQEMFAAIQKSLTGAQKPLCLFSRNSPPQENAALTKAGFKNNCVYLLVEKQ